MRLCDELRMNPSWGFGQDSKFPNQKSIPPGVESLLEESSVILELSIDALRKDADSKAFGTGFNRTEPKENKSSGIDDPSGRLTRMLVSAKSSEEIYTILSQAYKSLGEALTASASGDEKAMEVVRRLNKLIRRATRKLRDFSKENDMRLEQKRAEKKRLELLAKQLEEELKRKIAERKKREKKYLIDADKPINNNQKPIPGVSGIALEARLRMMEMAQKMAQASAAPPAAPAFSNEAGVSISGSGGESAAEDE